MNLPKYEDMQTLTQAYTGTVVDTQLEGAATLAIVTAAQAGSTSATVTYTVNSTQQARNSLIERLRHEGYVVTPGSTTMTVAWTQYFANPIS